LVLALLPCVAFCEEPVEPPKLKLRQTLKDQNLSFPSALAFSPDGKLLAVGSKFEKHGMPVGIWKGDKWHRPPRSLNAKINGGIHSLAYSPDGKGLVTATDSLRISRTGSSYRGLVVWNAISRRMEKQLDGLTTWENAVAFSPDGKTRSSGQSAPMIFRAVWEGCTAPTGLPTDEWSKQTRACVKTSVSARWRELHGLVEYSETVDAEPAKSGWNSATDRRQP
jgi:dipeptidyl aminopeptidase/acylaminoacyl peptidase